MTPVRYRVVVFDDARHTYEQAIDALAQVLGLTTVAAFDAAHAMSREGRTCHTFADLEEARRAEERFLSLGFAVGVDENRRGEWVSLSCGRQGAKGYERITRDDVARLREAPAAPAPPAPPLRDAHIGTCFFGLLFAAFVAFTLIVLLSS